MFRLSSFYFLNFLCIIFFSGFLFFNLFNIFSFYNINFFFNFFWNFKFMFFMDGISLLFVLLSIFLLFVCLLWYWYISYLSIVYIFVILVAIITLLNIFLTVNLMYFFFFYEFIAVPMLFFISLWGMKERKYLAGNLLFVYTLMGSFFVVFAMSYIYYLTGSLNFFYFLSLNFSKEIEIILFLFIFLGFSFKVPVVPLHLWLPEAHVEATTPGSVLLAGIVLKLSVYAYLRILVNFFFGWNYWLDLIVILSVFGFYIPSLVALVQNDIKKIIAYSSVSHMNFALIGFFEKSMLGFCGSIFMLFGHAFVASALFLSVGSLYERYKTRILYYYGGLMFFMPFWGFFFFIFILGNFGFPGTVNFVGEFLIFFAGINYSSIFFLFSFLGMLLTLIYSLFLYVRLSKGFINLEFFKYFSDLTRREFYIFLLFCLLTISLGIFPQIVFDYFFYLFLILIF